MKYIKETVIKNSESLVFSVTLQNIEFLYYFDSVHSYLYTNECLLLRVTKINQPYHIN